MFPSATTKNMTDAHNCATEAPCQQSWSFVQFVRSYCSGSVVGNFGFVVSITNSSPALIERILHIIASRAKEQMRRVYTRRIVAFVKHKQSVRYRPAVYLPRKTVNADALPAVSTDSNFSVSIFIAVSSPNPATTQNRTTNRAFLINVFPKAICNWLAGARFTMVAYRRHLRHENHPLVLRPVVRQTSPGFCLSGLYGGCV